MVDADWVPRVDIGIAAASATVGIATPTIAGAIRCVAAVAVAIAIAIAIAIAFVGIPPFVAEGLKTTIATGTTARSVGQTQTVVQLNKLWLKPHRELPD
jgi:hypothetical protein